MDIDKFLKPANDRHSIKEAVISLFLASPIEDVNGIIADLDPRLISLYNKRSELNSYKINVQLGKEDNQADLTNPIRVTGVRFINEKENKINYLLQLRNEEELNLSYISYHSLIYNRWKDFYESFHDSISLVNEHGGKFLIVAYSLHYIDEFKWIDDKSKIDLSLIFTENNDYIPSAFFKSDFPNIDITLNNTDENEEAIVSERVIIGVQSDMRTLTISHNLTQRLDSVPLSDLLIDERLKKILTKIHEKNKNLLKKILTEPIQNLINLPQNL